jgi:opacity protein-like surface antigen
MRRVVYIGMCLLVGLLIARPASAQSFVELYGGVTFTPSAEMTASRIVAAESASRTIDYDNSFVAGGRIGAWYEWIGFSADASYFRLDGNFADVTVVSASFLMMLRTRLFQTAEMPNGQLQPYLAVGPGFFLADTDADFRPNLSQTISAFSGIDDIGLDVRAGAAWEFASGFALFSEYRFALIPLDGEKPFLNDSGPVTETFDTTVMSHQVIGGLSYRF